MENKLGKKNSALLSKKRYVIIAIGPLLLVLIIVGLFFLMQPHRTVANFCQTAKDEKSYFRNKGTATPKKPEVTVVRKVHGG